VVPHDDLPAPRSADALGRTARAGWVYLVGAGPGDPALITVRGSELLRSADLVLHDELIDPALLEQARADAELCPVGKRGNAPQAKQRSQRHIEQQMVHAAQAGRSVVRLKGGDPFLFGRGSEEVMALRAAAVPYQVVPGVVSPVGATAYAGVPLTHRALSRSVTFVTAVMRDGAEFDWSELASLGGTLCVFMGLRRLASVCRGLIELAGRSADTPAAVVHWISYPKQQTVSGTLADVAARSEAAGLDSPSLLIVGAVVSLREQLRWFDAQPLFGKRVLITRPAHQVAPTAAMLRGRGAQPLPFPTIAITDPPDPEPARRAAAELESYQLVVFTSDNAVARFFTQLEELGRDARAFGRSKVAAIGPATAAGLRRRGIEPDVVAERFVAEALAEAILRAIDDPANCRVLLPRALVAREALPEALRLAGMAVDVVPVYQTRSAAGAEAERLRSMLRDGEVDVVTLTSSSTVDQLVALLGEAACELLESTTLASIGPITTATAEQHGLTVAVTAEHSTSEGLIDALEAWAAQQRPEEP
jgi:uroporphyrinogen III methyltransferase/synthase